MALGGLWLSAMEIAVHDFSFACLDYVPCPPTTVTDRNEQGAGTGDSGSQPAAHKGVVPGTSVARVKLGRMTISTPSTSRGSSCSDSLHTCKHGFSGYCPGIPLALQANLNFLSIKRLDFVAMRSWSEALQAQVMLGMVKPTTSVSEYTRMLSSSHQR